MDIEIYSGDTKAIISSKGGYATNLSDMSGDIFFPKRVLTVADGSEKIRGGAHVCVPNFGPGDEFGLDQHGYARVRTWRIVASSSHSVTLELEGEGTYAGLNAQLHYEIEEALFTSTLSLHNTSPDPLVVAPAFHPYYAHKGAVTIDDEQYASLEGFREAHFITGSTHTTETATRRLTHRSTALATWAIWTDQLGDYLCIEPTQSGFAFSQDISRADTLESGETKVYSYQVGWSSIEN